MRGPSFPKRKHAKFTNPLIVVNSWAIKTILCHISFKRTYINFLGTVTATCFLAGFYSFPHRPHNPEVIARECSWSCHYTRLLRLECYQEGDQAADPTITRTPWRPWSLLRSHKKCHWGCVCFYRTFFVFLSGTYLHFLSILIFFIEYDFI